MSNQSGTTPREAVGLFAKRADFDAAVAALLAAGFDRTDLSLMGSHESVEAAAGEDAPVDSTLRALLGEARVVEPLTWAGGIVLAGGPVLAGIAGLIAAGIGAVAIKDVLAEVLSAPDRDDFERALEAGGLILWVRCTETGGTETGGVDTARADTAQDILRAHRGRNVHMHDATSATDGH
ncbi:MAG: hypothetical protein ACTSRY_02850 [Alphaproteobacteria bacterium]